MSSKDLFSPYINRFKAITQQMSDASLELFCEERKVTVNLNHDLGAIPRQNNYLKLPVTLSGRTFGSR